MPKKKDMTRDITFEPQDYNNDRSFELYYNHEKKWAG